MKTTNIKNVLEYTSGILGIITFLIVLGLAGSVELDELTLTEFFKHLLLALPTGVLSWACAKVSNIF